MHAGAGVLVFGKSFALIIAILFGLSGLPLSIWLFRNDKSIKWLDKLVFGYIFSLILVPALFIMEVAIGINFSTPLVFANWALIFILGLALAAKDGALAPPKPGQMLPSSGWLPSASVFFLMAAVFLIGFSVAGAIIFELDPYYYIEGVKQIVYEGKNYLNDGAAWYPYQTGHFGQPVWKYPIASWFSIYNGGAPYSPYIIAAVVGIQPPIIGALAVFAIYFLFREIYGHRVGFLAAGSMAFMPTMLIKFQGGNFQVEPFNIFALLLFFGSVLYAFRRQDRIEPLILFCISYLAITLGSNLSSLVIFSFSVFMFLASLAHMFSSPGSALQSRNFMLKLFCAMAAAMAFSALYAFSLEGLGFVGGLVSSLISNLLLPFAAFSVPWMLDEGLPRAKVSASPMQKFAVLCVLALAFLVIGPRLPVVSELVKGYITFGAYTTSLERTIAEQAPGSEIYAGQFGFAASALSTIQNPSNDLFVSLFSFLFQAIGAVNAVPNFLLNATYAVFVWGMNNIAGANFDLVQKGNSLMTFFLFFSLALLAAHFGKAAMRKENWPTHVLLLFPFIFSVSLVAFGKQKLVMYLGIALVMAIGAFWGEAEAFISEHFIRAPKKKESPPAYFKHLPAVSWILVVGLVLLQFGSPALFDLGAYSGSPGALYSTFAPQYGLRAMPLLLYSLTPRIYDSPETVLPKMQAYCIAAPGDPVCSLVTNWNATINIPSQYFSYDLCARSLWPNPGKQPPPDMGLVFSYRCSFVSTYWLDSMEWLNKNMDGSDRLISWWDYGHWTNFFAQKKTVLRNEHAHLDMIGRTAYAFVLGTPKDLRDAMRAYGSRTALFDVEIIGGGTREQISFGGKFGALNYLGCAWANETSVNLMPTQSSCEQNNTWETAYVPLTPALQKRCVISESSQIAGVEGYVVSQSAGGQAQAARYCFTEGVIGGQRRLMAYKLGASDENGDLKLQKAVWNVVGNDGQTAVLQAVYTKDKIWPDASGTLVDGWADRATKFYNSNLYSAFMLNELEGFDLVYNSPQIRIFKMKDEYYNSDR